MKFLTIFVSFLVFPIVLNAGTGAYGHIDTSFKITSYPVIQADASNKKSNFQENSGMSEYFLADATDTPSIDIPEIEIRDPGPRDVPLPDKEKADLSDAADKAKRDKKAAEEAYK